MLSKREGLLAGIASMFAASSPRSVKAASAVGVSISTEEFLLSLGGDWREVPSDDPNQVICDSAALRSAVVASVIRAAIPRDRLVEAAERLWEFRQQAEIEVRTDLFPQARSNLVFEDTYVGFRERDQAGHVAYGGHDDALIFRFWGWTTERKILSFWLGTDTRDPAFAQGIAEEIMLGGGFQVAFP